MALRTIRLDDDEILRKKSKPVKEINGKIFELLDDMLETLHSKNGVGLAAPQVGVLKRVAIVSTDGETVYELINPVILKRSGSQIGVEGCLSIPGKSGYVERPKKLTVEAQDRFGNIFTLRITDPYTAVAFCHELDHLDGMLYTDKVIPDYKPPEGEEE